jgi:hypothetical protein
MLEQLLEEYAKHKIELALQKNDDPLILEERVKNSYSKQTPFVIISPVPHRRWHGDFNPFTAEKRFRENGSIEGKTPFFVINNEGDAHWNFYRSENPTQILESSGDDLACGAYTFANIIKNSAQFQGLDSVQELLKWFMQEHEIDLKTADVNQLVPDKVRKFVAQAIEIVQQNLVSHPNIFPSLLPKPLAEQLVNLS